MLTATTIDGLKALRLDAMAAASPSSATSRLRRARLRGTPRPARRPRTDRPVQPADGTLPEDRPARAAATVEDIDFHHPRSLDRGQVSPRRGALGGSHQAVLVTGPTGAGKTYLACAWPTPRSAAATPPFTCARACWMTWLSPRRRAAIPALAAWARIGVLILDDLLLRPLTSEQAADLLEVIEDRARLRATIITSQLRSSSGIRPSPIPPSPTPSSTGRWRKRTASNYPASPCGGPPLPRQQQNSQPAAAQAPEPGQP